MSITSKSEIIKELKEKLTINQGATIKSLLEILDTETTKHLINEIFLLVARHKKNEASNRKGVLQHNEYSIEFNRINDSLLSLIDKLDEKTAIIYLYKNSIFNFITIICRTKERVSSMQSLFPKRRYKNVKIYEETEFLVLENSEEKEGNNQEHTELIIYDNFPKSSAKSSIPPRLSEILADESIKAKVLFYSPKEARELQREEYLERVYFSNSPFSIHARIDEMLLYLKNKK